MISRRAVLKGVIAAGAGIALRQVDAAVQAATQTPVNFDVPAGAFDCHTHVIPDPKQFPFWPDRPYTPEPATAAESIALHRRLHVDRIVIVQPSFYDTDMAPTLDGLRQMGPKARAIAVIDDKATPAYLDKLHAAGVRGVRLNFQTFALAGNQTNADAARQRFNAALEQIRGRKWHIQLFAQLSVIEGIQSEIMNSPVPVVVDHFAYAKASLGPGQPGFATLLKLVRAGKLWVKVSAPYRLSSLPNDYSDMTPLAEALIEANPQCVLWGTDWPHPAGAEPPGHPGTDVVPNLPIDNGRLLNLLGIWAPDAGLRKTILVENPARLLDV